MTPTTELNVVVLGQMLPAMAVESCPINFSHNAYAGGEYISRELIRRAPWRKQQVADALRGCSD